MSIDLSELKLTPEEEANVLASFELLRPKLAEGERRKVSGSSADYEVLRRGATNSCSCPAWRNQRIPIQFRTCKHLGQLLGVSEEQERVQSAARAAGRKLPANPHARRGRR